MRANREIIDMEVHQNYEYFKTQLPELMKEHEDEYVLIRKKKIINFFKNVSDAYWFGREEFPDRIYSLQKVTDQPIILRNMGHELA